MFAEEVVLRHVPVGGLLGTKFAYKMRDYEIGSSQSIDNEIEPGAVFLRGANAPYDYGLLTIESSIEKSGYRTIVQKIYPITDTFNTDGIFKIRIGELNSGKLNWSDWKTYNSL